MKEPAQEVRLWEEADEEEILRLGVGAREMLVPFWLVILRSLWDIPVKVCHEQ